MAEEQEVIEIDIEAMGKPRLTRRDIWQERETVRRWYAYKDELRLKLRGFELTERLVIDFYLPMPSSWSRKRREAMDGQPHRRKPDVDNLAKGFMDALSDDDSYVWDLHARKFWAARGAIIVHLPRDEFGSPKSASRAEDARPSLAAFTRTPRGLL